MQLPVDFTTNTERKVWFVAGALLEEKRVSQGVYARWVTSGAIGLPTLLHTLGIYTGSDVGIVFETVLFGLIGTMLTTIPSTAISIDNELEYKKIVRPFGKERQQEAQDLLKRADCGDFLSKEDWMKIGRLFSYTSINVRHHFSEIRNIVDGQTETSAEQLDLFTKTVRVNDLEIPADVA